jgi:hypothetical protein
MSSLYIGTSAFTGAGWEGSFYPPGTKPGDFLRVYQFDRLHAVNVSQVDPLPHQIEAVYHYILRNPPLQCCILGITLNSQVRFPLS